MRLEWITNNTEFQEIYDEIRRRTKAVVRKNKLKYLEDKINEIENNYNNGRVRNFYAEIRKEKNGFKVRINVIKDNNDSLIVDTHQIIKRWKDFFENLLNTKQAVQDTHN